MYLGKLLDVFRHVLKVVYEASHRDRVHGSVRWLRWAGWGPDVYLIISQTVETNIGNLI